MQRCPYCGKPNQAASSFCIHCGEPIDEESVRESALAPSTATLSPSSVASPGATRLRRFLPDGIARLFSSERAVEFAVGAAIIVGIIGFAVYLGFQQSDKAVHYDRAVQAEQAGKYELALTEYAGASDYRDTPQRSALLRNKLATRDMFYTKAMAQRKAGKWWQAAISFKRASDIQPDYKDIAQQLANIRLVNGRIFYRQSTWIEGHKVSGLFMAWADGGDPVQLPDTGRDSTLLAVSRDGRYVVYNLYTVVNPTTPRPLVLYDVVRAVTYRLSLPMPAITTGVTARFAQDSRLLWLQANNVAVSYQVPPDGTPAGTLQPNQSATPPKEVSLTISRGQAGDTLSVVKNAGLDNGGTFVHAEQGTVDGAVLSDNAHYLLYRVCGHPDSSQNYTCTIKLVDLTLQQPYIDVLDRLPMRGNDTARFDLRAEFTRDGRYVLLTERYGGDTEVHLYSLDSGERWAPSTEATSALTGALHAAPLLPLGVPGIGAWQGPNELTFSSDALALPEGQGEWQKRYYGRSHWVTISPNYMYLLYLDGDTAQDGSPLFKLAATPLMFANLNGDGTVPLLSTKHGPASWLSSLYMLPEGGTLLSTEPPSPDSSTGLYGYDLQTGTWTLTLPGVTDLYPLGYASFRPAIPSFDPGR